MERVRIRIVSAEQGKCGASLDKGVEIVYDFHNHMNLNAMTGKTSLRAFQRAAGCCEAVCGQMIYWPSSSQLKAFRGRRWDRVPRRYQRGAFAPMG